MCGAYGTCGRPKRALDFLDLELQMVLRQPVRVLDTALGSSSRAVCTLNHWAFTPALTLFLTALGFGHHSEPSSLFSL